MESKKIKKPSKKKLYPDKVEYERVLQYLIDTSYNKKSDILKFNHSQMAKDLAMSPSQISRALNRLIDSKYIKEYPREYHFTDYFLTKHKKRLS